MSNVTGSISLNVEFRDSTSTSGVQRLKTISLRDSKEYATGGFVALITGTAGTAAVTFGDLGQTPYRNADGDLVEFTGELSRLVFSWSGSYRTLSDGQGADAYSLISQQGLAAMCGLSGPPISPVISGGSGTGTYTIIIYAD